MNISYFLSNLISDAHPVPRLVQTQEEKQSRTVLGERSKGEIMKALSHDLRMRIVPALRAQREGSVRRVADSQGWTDGGFGKVVRVSSWFPASGK